VIARSTAHVWLQSGSLARLVRFVMFAMDLAVHEFGTLRMSRTLHGTVVNPVSIAADCGMTPMG
jgi:hypothetical protein